MKQFSIGELLIYDPKRQSQKRKPIESDMQQAKIVSYYPQDAPLQQKCNTVGMAEGVFEFARQLTNGPQSNQEQRGWQMISLDSCTLLLSEVEPDVWLFAKLDHSIEPYYHRLGEPEDHGYCQDNFSQDSCKIFMSNFYSNFILFHGLLRGWIFRDRIIQLQKLVSHFVSRYQELYRHEGALDMVSYLLADIRMIPLDVSTTLKFNYFKNVLQSYNDKVAHLMVFSHGVLAYSSLGKESTHLLSKYLFSHGQPYLFQDNARNRFTILSQLPLPGLSPRYGILYNSRLLGFEDQPEAAVRSSINLKAQGNDLLGLESQQTSFDLFEVYLQDEELPLRVSFYAENSLLFVTFFRQRPELNELVFQNRFYHDNSEKFMQKINQAIPAILKPNDPYRFLFHNCATLTGKSTLRDWKYFGRQIRQAIEMLRNQPQGLCATSSPHGYWIYGVRRFARILILLVPTDISLGRVEDYVSKMTREYFSRAFM